MKRFSCFAAIFMVLAFSARVTQGQACLPVITPPTIDGIVATDPFHLLGGVPNADIGWAIAPYQSFTIIKTGIASSTDAFFLGTKLSGTNPDHLYVGVHVEGADQFSTGDKAVLYFDTDQNGTFDFALGYEIGPGTLVFTGQNSGQVPNEGSGVHFYTFSAGSFSDQTLTLTPGTINSRTAWNFPIASNGIWELEIDINLTALKTQFPTITVANKIGFGGRLYVQPAGGVAAVALDWPAGLSTDLNPNDTFPGTGGVLAANLDKRDVKTTCAGDVQVKDVRSNSAKLGPGTFYRPTTSDINGVAGENLPAALQTTLTGAAELVNTGNAGDTSPTGGTDSGFVHFFLMPWGAGPVETIDLGTVPASINQFGVLFPSGSANVSWPKTKTDWNNHSSNFSNASSTHACLKVVLEGFPADSTLTGSGKNDEQQINLSYTHLSTQRDKIVIRALGTPIPGAAKENYAMRIRWDNVPKNMVKDPGHDKECWLSRLCDRLHHRTRWQAKVVNAPELGIKPLKANGYYGLQLAPGEQVVAEIELSGAVMPVPAKTQHISARAGGQVLSPGTGEPAVTVPVPDGGMVTVIANGEIAVTGGANVAAPQLHNANGFSARQLIEDQFLLSSKAQQPWRVTGALIGAFKPDFSDSFFIGTDKTFYVTPGSTTLYLAVNDVAGQYGDNSGPGFDLNIVATPPTSLPTKLSRPANSAIGLPGIAQPAANLPVLVVDLFKLDAADKATVPVGYVAYAVYAAHGTAKPNEGGAGTTNPR